MGLLTNIHYLRGVIYQIQKNIHKAIAKATMMLHINHHGIHTCHDYVYPLLNSSIC